MTENLLKPCCLHYVTVIFCNQFSKSLHNSIIGGITINLLIKNSFRVSGKYDRLVVESQTHRKPINTENIE